MSQIRNAVFVWNNYDDVARIAAKLKAWKQVSYCVIGEEIGEKEKTPHLQGYIEFKASVARTTLLNKIEKNWVEIRRGTAEQAANYCKKGEQPKDEFDELGVKGPNYGKNAKVIEWGEISAQGTRNDLSPACEMIKAGKRMRDVAVENPVLYVKYHRGMHALKAILVEPRTALAEVQVFYGKTGTGKSHKSREWLGPDDLYVHGPQQDKWFDGYEGQKNVLFEEFRGGLPFGFLMMLLDKWDAKVQYKGGMIEFAATRIAIASPIHPSQWYDEVVMKRGDDIEQLLRRCTKITHVQHFVQPKPSPSEAEFFDAVNGAEEGIWT